MRQSDTVPTIHLAIDHSEHDAPSWHYRRQTHRHSRARYAPSLRAAWTMRGMCPKWALTGE